MSTEARCFNPTADELAALQAKFRLSYHVPYLSLADQMIGLAGKDVLEVGGSLPEEFVVGTVGVRSWVAVETMNYWNIVLSTGANPGATHARPSIRLADATKATIACPHIVLEGVIEHLPQALEGSFDVAVSLACFEHIHELPEALLAIYRSLRPGGVLFTMFSPIWSAHDGHHLPEVTDKSGKQFYFKASPIPPWGHLLLRPPAMIEFLRGKTDTYTAHKIAYYIYQSPHINRLFTEDYLNFVRQSPFIIERMEATFSRPVPEAVQAELKRLHPGREQFSNNGLLLVLRKPKA